jgi:DNA-binding NarL/FixJ family response regulator
LTLREREVLRLLAQGRSNQEIAGELVLSVRTVERHISNVYAKIGASGRAARAAAASHAASLGIS